MSDRSYHGRSAVAAAVFDIPSTPVDASWLIETGRWEPIGSARIRSAEVPPAHLTMMLKVVRGNWQITYQDIG